MTKTLMIDYDERMTDSVKETIQTALDKLIELGKVKGYEMSEIPQADPVPVASNGVLD